MLIKDRILFFKRIDNYLNIKINGLEQLTNFQIKGPLGKIAFNCSNQQLRFLNNEENGFIIKKNKYNIFLLNFREAIRGVFVPWLRSFIITGYQYKIAYSYKRHQLSVGLGFTYWIVLDLTTNNTIFLKIIKGKFMRSISRKFILASIDYTEFQILQKFLNTVRNLLPYQLKGLTFPNVKIKLKKSKQAKRK